MRTTRLMRAIDPYSDVSCVTEGNTPPTVLGAKPLDGGCVRVQYAISLYTKLRVMIFWLDVCTNMIIPFFSTEIDDGHM